MSLWFVMAAAGLLTYATRLSFIHLFAQMEVPPRVRQALRFVPPAVLSAIIFPELLMPGGSLQVSPTNIRLVAGIFAFLVAWRTRNVVWTVIAGMLALWLLQAIM